MGVQTQLKREKGKTMGIASIREVKITPGNTEVVSSRVRKGAGILARHGAHTRIYRVVGGQGAGNIQLQAHYASVSQGAETFEAFSKDASYTELMQEIENAPAGEVMGPQLVRYAYGDAGKEAASVIVVRAYHMPRAGLPKALELAPKLEELMKPMGISVAAAVPLLGEDHEMMGVIYRFKSMLHWGESVDEMLSNETLSGIINSANEIGTLKSSRLMSLM